jgi:hypothetical protein
VKRFDASSLGKPSQTDWQILGELELPLDADHNDVISTWLNKNLSPLTLQADFINRILKSALAAAANASQPTNTALETRHIHLVVFAPPDYKTDAKTWGFFRIEKLASLGGDKKPLDHSIEFYLYIEGQ